MQANYFKKRIKSFNINVTYANGNSLIANHKSTAPVHSNFI